MSNSEPAAVLVAIGADEFLAPLEWAMGGGQNLPGGRTLLDDDQLADLVSRGYRWLD